MVKNTKFALFGLAIAWVSLLLIEKFTGAAGMIKRQNKMWPIRAGYFSARLIKSAILFCLAALNVFMAIALIDRKKQ